MGTVTASTHDEVRRRQQAFYRDAESVRYRWLTEHPFIAKAERKLFEPLIRLRSRQSIFEIGCGEGANLVTLRRMGCEAKYTGGDCFPQKIDFCRAHHRDAQFVIADARQRLPFEDGSFDGVLIRDVLHHLAEPDRVNALRESMRILRRGGVLAIIEGNANNPIALLFAMIFPHERCMLETRSHLLRDLIERTVGSEPFDITMAEPSNLFRLILHYQYGFPLLGKIRLCRRLLDGWDRLAGIITPRRYRAYTLVEVSKEQFSEGE